MFPEPYANLPAVRALEPAAYAAVTVRLPATALILRARYSSLRQPS
jgi:hypothetical protein